MKKVTFSLLFIAFLSELGFAQLSFKDVVITKKDGSEVSGQIDYQKWQMSPQSVRFKAADGTMTTFLPDEIRGFNIKENVERYVSAVVERNQESLNDRNLSEFNSIKEAVAYHDLKKDTLFLMTLVSGFANLYVTLNGDNSESFFIQKERSTIDELVYRRVSILREGYKTVSEIKEYITELKKQFGDCPSVYKNLEFQSFNRKALMRTVSAYNQCKGTPSTYTQLESKNAGAFYAFGGVNVSSLTLTDYQIVFKKAYRGLTSPTLGIGYDFNFDKNRNRFGLAAEILYKNVKTTQTEEYRNNGGNISKLVYDFNMTLLQTNLLARYTIYSGKAQIYAKGGIGAAFNIYENTLVETDFTLIPFVVNMEAKRLETNLLVGLGVKMNKFFVEGRFGSGLNISPYVVRRFSLDYVNVLFGYYFGHNF